jgi:hypothetical protein
LLRPERLTIQNVKEHEKVSEQEEKSIKQLSDRVEVKKEASEKKKEGTKKKRNKKQKGKPAWAMTEKELVEKEDKEVDTLIDFAYDLDYEKYIEDFEVRQALEAIKERVKEIRNDENWKKELVDEWNHPEDIENQKEEEKEKSHIEQIQKYKRKKEDDEKSVISKSTLIVTLLINDLKSQERQI